MSPIVDYPSPHLADCNVSSKRQALEPLAPPRATKRVPISWSLLRWIDPALQAVAQNRA